MGLVAIEGMEFYAYHGFYPEEQIIGTEYVVDVYIETDFDKAAFDDDLDGTINYETIYRVTKIEMQKKTKLLETIGQRIIDRVKVLFETIESIKVRVSKKNPPIGSKTQRAYIEVTEDFVVKCGKCGRGFLSHIPGDCWTKHGQVYPETRATLMRSFGGNICKRCLTPYFIKSRDA